MGARRAQEGKPACAEYAALILPRRCVSGGESRGSVVSGPGQARRKQPVLAPTLSLIRISFFVVCARGRRRQKRLQLRCKADRYRGNWWRNAYEQPDWKLFEHFTYFLCLVWGLLGATSTNQGPARHRPLAPAGTAAQDHRSLPRRRQIVDLLGVRRLAPPPGPRHKVLVVSASKERADQFSTFALSLINGLPICPHLIPEEHHGRARSPSTCELIRFHASAS